MQKEELDDLIGDEFDEIETDNNDLEEEIIDDDTLEDDDIIDDSDEEVIEDDVIDDDEEEIIADDADEEIIDDFADVLSEADEKSEEDTDEEVYPPPADNKHKVVAQLDEVTKESEEKATQILDIMDEVGETIENNTNEIKEILNFLNKHKNLCETLHKKFPHIKTFELELKEIEDTINKVNELIEKNEEASDKIFTVMDIMQYQDIHRQKIERVINIMRALIKYMNKLFEGSVEDEKRVQSARHIHGDTNNEVLSDDDIEALLDQFGV